MVHVNSGGTILIPIGELFVRRCLGYITAARYGLSVNELFGCLNKDQEVLDFVFQVTSNIHMQVF